MSVRTWRLVDAEGRGVRTWLKDSEGKRPVTSECSSVALNGSTSEDAYEYSSVAPDGRKRQKTREGINVENKGDKRKATKEHDKATISDLLGRVQDLQRQSEVLWAN